MNINLEQFYDKERKIFTYPEDEIDIEPNGLGYFLFNKLKESFGKIAQIEAETGNEDLYECYYARVIRTALKMISMGLGPDDIISICSYNHLNTTVPLLAAIFLGIKVASLDPTLSMEDIKHLISLVKPKVVFTSDDSEKLVEDAAEAASLDTIIISFQGTEGYKDFADFIEFKGDVEGFVPYKPSDLKDTVLIMFSSGTTGMPKGLCLNHEYFLKSLALKAPIDVVLVYSSLYWISKNILTFLSIKHGKTQLICKKNDLNLTWHYIEKYKVTTTFLASCDAIKLSEHISEIHADNLLLALLSIGGSLIPWDVIQKFRAAVPQAGVCNYYGITECANLISPFYTPAYNKQDCIGIPAAGFEYKVVDPTTEEVLGPNQPGELRVKSRFCMSGYYKQDSSDAWDSDGYLKTGDIMYYDEEYCFYIVDRIKEMFKYKSWHIVPAKLEKILLSHPAVMLAVVVGKPHREDDNHAVAIVVPRSEAEITPEELKKFVDDRVDERYRLVGGVRFVESLPMTPSGKIQRRTVTKMVASNEI